MQTEENKLVKEILSFIENQLEEPVRYDYSGRGMFGRKCPAITTDQVFDTLAQLVEAIAWALEGREDFTVAEVFRWFKYETDNMGLSTVIYFRYLDDLEDAQ